MIPLPANDRTTYPHITIDDFEIPHRSLTSHGAPSSLAAREADESAAPILHSVASSQRSSSRTGYPLRPSGSKFTGVPS